MIERVGPIAPRCRMLTGFYAEQLPDVICLQEFLASWRLAENETILFSLRRYGYEEAEVGTVLEITPHHRRICTTATPILYKKDKLNLLRCGVRKFDVFNGGGDDKFATWAVFEPIGSGKKFAVISVHLAWQNDADGDRWRVEQAGEVLEIARSIHAEENCPVLLGGDLNSLPTSASYAVFSESEARDVRDLAEEADDTCTHFGGPRWDAENQTYHPHDDRLTGDWLTDAYDHVFLLGEGIDFKRFRVIRNELTRSISDHVPLMIDLEL